MSHANASSSSVFGDRKTPLDSLTPLSELECENEFVRRHLGPQADDEEQMLKALGLKSFTELVAQTVPKQIRSEAELDLHRGLSEAAMLAKARAYASQNKVFKSFIGQGYYGTLTPTVILRNITENPTWYTAYTPYQAEISQGRLEALLNFQTMIIDLTALPVANASLLDEGTAAAEAMALAHAVSKKKNASRFLLAENCHPQTIEVVLRRAEPLGIKVVVQKPEQFEFDEITFGCLVQYPATDGSIADYTGLAKRAHDSGVTVVAATDLLALTLLVPPGEWGADIAIGSSQRFGVPLGFGGPHAAFMATRDEFKRSLPGRLIGVSIDAEERPAMRLALQTREQHIRREKATSNICTAQVLLAVMASMYAVYHGPNGLRKIALRTHRLAATFASGLTQLGLNVASKNFFDTVTVVLTSANEAEQVVKRALAQRMNIRRVSAQVVAVSFDELSAREDVIELWSAFAGPAFDQGSKLVVFDKIETKSHSPIGESLWRKSAYLTHPVFNTHRSETEMLRYMTHLQGKDLSLAHAMIPLGSCTMKLNATSEMIPVTWPEFNQLHPFAPLEQVRGSLAMIKELEQMLAQITGFAAISLQPNSGAAGEYAGLLAIREYHQARGQGHRKVCLIPSSAHGTNPASAVMAGMEVVVVKCDDQGNVDLADLKGKAQLHKNDLAALMITYPSTHGVFEEGIRDICDAVHDCGGQVYMDGANFNALVGLARPGEFGPDVMHLNLHKTFCIPHGGGGPGVGPIGVRSHLKEFLPGSSVTRDICQASGLRDSGVTAVASAPFGSASILPISWAYISMMGREGLQRASEVAILNANYIAQRLAPHYPILYKGKNGRVAHECIIDLRPIKAASGIDVEDVAKRLIDYGFHAPTMSWPVVGTLMIEPTESEPKAELDRFCEAMIAIREEIRAIEQKKIDAENNPLKRAPHTLRAVTATEWARPYSREQAAFPLAWVKDHKFWPSVARVNNAFGDRHFVCSCPPLEDYESPKTRA